MVSSFARPDSPLRERQSRSPLVRVDAHVAHQVATTSKGFVTSLVGAGVRSGGAGGVVVDDVEEIHVGDW